jgi:dTDP-4-dehydrorhamnose 3,5-epimerase
MLYTPMNIKDAFVVDLTPIGDSRGFFSRVFCQREFAQHGLDPRVMQINNSYNADKGTLRGLHYQLPPFQETKLVRVVRGALWDVIVDLRQDSPTFGQWDAVTLTAEKRNMIMVPRGCAHGIITLEDHTEMLYFVSEHYAPEHERGLKWDDPRFNIDWPIDPKIISDKDKANPYFDPEYHLWS